MTADDGIQAWMSARREALAEALTEALPAEDRAPQKLHAAMHHACNGGKRLRGLLVYACGEALGAPQAALHRCAVAVELMHAYSLVHDDMPCMDDDTLRRGQPTVHRQWDEATAVLTGDALQALAFETLARADAPGFGAEARLRCIAHLAVACGSHGMCGGQSLDMESEGQDITLPELENIHIMKTGELILACARMAVACAGAENGSQAATLERAMKRLGLAFQIHDDLLDIEGSTAELGKTAGKDCAAAKASFPAMLGPVRALERMQRLYDEAESCLTELPHAEALRKLVAEMRKRRR